MVDSTFPDGFLPTFETTTKWIASFARLELHQLVKPENSLLLHPPNLMHIGRPFDLREWKLLGMNCGFRIRL